MAKIGEVLEITNSTQFVHLRVHSPYSLLEGACRFEDLCAAALQHNMPAMAITDRNNLFAALEAAQLLSDARIQPIPATTLTLYPDGDGGLNVAPVGTLALYARDAQGYQNLMRLVSHAHIDTTERPMAGVSLSYLAQHGEGLICLTGGPEGVINQAFRRGNNKDAESFLSFLMNVFSDNLYIELQRYTHFEPSSIEAMLLEFAYQNDVPIVATNQCFFMREDDYVAHDALLCIADGRYVSEDDRRRVTPEHYFKSPDAMVALFSDLPEALANTIEIARRCAFMPQTHPPILPVFSADDEAALLTASVHEGLEARLAEAPLVAPREEYDARLKHELDIIIRMGFAGYFLIVADFIKWARQQQIAVGPGRGSGAGSIVAWVLTITELDPLRFGLIFERFLNPERVSMPDFDIDFCQARRDEVIHYVQEKYGAEHVAQIITFGKLQARLVMRDVGRVLQLPYSQVDRLCKTAPNIPDDSYTLAKAMHQDPILKTERDNDPRVDEMLQICAKLEGLYRHSSTHAAGVVIGDSPLYERVPLYRDPRAAMLSTQFSMKWVEAAGLVKFDFLGLKTLTVIERAIAMLAERGIDINITSLPLDDAKTYAMLSIGDTMGVFQLESNGMRDVLRRMKPDSFEDIIALVALYRPGPMEMIPQFIKRKHGKEKISYAHPDLQPILQETQGIPIYQEQVMQIAQTLSGFSLGEADLLRRAMGKKNASEMRAQRAGFIEGAVARGVDTTRATKIFETIEKFAGYGFNKSHAAGYALIAYQTAYIKANYPVAFYAASMSLDYERTEKLEMFRHDALMRDIETRPPDINSSDVYFSLAPDGNAILYGLAAVRNVGTAAVQAIVDARNAGGAFSDMFDFMARITGGGLHRRLMENLIGAGAFDSLVGVDARAQLVAGLDMLLGVASKTHAERDTGQVSLFGEGESKTYLKLPAMDAWTLETRLAHEIEALGFYLSDHPLTHYQKKFGDKFIRLKITSSADVMGGQNTHALLAGVLHDVKERKSKKGNKYALLTLSDQSGYFEVFVFAEQLNAARALLIEGTLLFLGVEAERRNEQTRLKASVIHNLIDKIEGSDTVPEAHAREAQNNHASDTYWRIYVENITALPQIKTRLDAIGAHNAPASSNVALIMMGKLCEVELTLPHYYRLSPQLGQAIRAIEGVIALDADNKTAAE